MGLLCSGFLYFLICRLYFWLKKERDKLNLLTALETNNLLFTRMYEFNVSYDDFLMIIWQLHENGLERQPGSSQLYKN